MKDVESTITHRLLMLMQSLDEGRGPRRVSTLARQA